MVSDYYYTVNGQQAAAPASAAQLRQMAALGQLQPHDLVWQEGMTSWAPASTVQGLFVGRPGETPPRPRRRGRTEPAGEIESPGGLLGLHPLLVVLLCVVSGGLFGLVFVYLVCAAYANQPDRRVSDAAGRPLGRLRHPLGVGLLCYLTFGLYGIWWRYRVMSECLAYAGRRDLHPRLELTLMLLFPPYAVFVSVFRLPELLAAARLRAKLPEASAARPAPLFLLPCLLVALPLLSMAQQDALNQTWLQAP